ncbi:2-amino-4-hydroxy-6-hydroxymethyldihydropteridine diphosphokinase [Paracraurococcus lichenis]|uniref:2-amino-4-hydroxy-6-hydroxymethyldihydropteridine pyrophosphokinase n=1 Tax=Paracraurococcus lichenis TaxID=3064888 RepID=A0ABT9EAN5_9PROT|nr:2-amino-4-hydroxy-6-hydroxymethyldihydropteridine diphosphokinase [Paracraurococcus sp. LOR1-02]MDO9712980.1 2-amino-4-hydroxy-6-hydroxymethyldihydropteridine diphosphokinase [Paracraurococcus sp. LOR1-02]
MILIALGASIPDPSGRSPLETCRLAAAALDGLPGLCLRAVSKWYQTAPVPPVPGAPPFVNGVARLEGGAGDPACLLAALHAIEDRAGRQRPYPNAPRSLDLDLIDIDGLRRAGPDPILPHPRAHLRRFVLVPLSDVAPDWIHPVLGLGIPAMLAALPPEEPPPVTLSA